MAYTASAPISRLCNPRQQNSFRVESVETAHAIVFDISLMLQSPCPPVQFPADPVSMKPRLSY
jgi:hypothetical protein